MKILHLTSSMNPKGGGVCQAIRDIIYGISLIDNNIVNEVVCLDNADEYFLKQDIFKIHALGKGKTSWNYNKNLFRWLEKNIENYDKTIVHGLWQYQSYAVYSLWEKRTFQYFVMPHGMLDPYFQLAKERKLKALRNELFWDIIEKKLVNNASALLFTCEEEKLLAKKTFTNYFPKKEQVVGLGIDSPPPFFEKMTTAFTEKVPQWNRKQFILFLSRIHKKKGIDLLIQTYNKLQTEILHLPQLIIAGPVESDYALEMQKLAQNNKNILFAGMLSGDAKWGAFYNCECFVLPSHQENFGIAIVEAMACRKPVLITNKVNIWREIESGSGGLVANDTEEEIYKQLKTFLFLSEKEKTQMGENAFCAYQKYFSIEKAAEKMIEALCFMNKTSK